jgi:hypothetical protein
MVEDVREMDVAEADAEAEVGSRKLTRRRGGAGRRRVI